MRNMGSVNFKLRDAEGFTGHLAQSPDWRQESSASSSMTFYDTFDWRLYRKSILLVLREEGDCRKLCCNSFSGNLLALLDSPPVPGFAWDLTGGKLRQVLEPIVKMRRLLPQATLHSRQQLWALLNDEGKTVLRLLVSSEREAEDATGSRQPLCPCLELFPVKGYGFALEQLSSQLMEANFTASIEQRKPLEEILQVLGRQPQDYSSKLELDLQPQLSGRQSLCLILLTLLDVLKRNLHGIQADVDTEFLHDFRVAIRRTRSALGQLKGLLPAQQVEPYRRDFAWLGGITGPMRDLDVYLLNFSSYCKLLPEIQRENLDPFRRFLEKRRNQELGTLKTHLKSRRFNEMATEWQNLLQRELESVSPMTEEDRPVRKVADRRIWKLFRRCIKEGGAIQPQSPAEDLHELRKTCKKLRYLLEFFQSLYPPDSMADLIGALKGLQDNLGEIQDFEVQSESMRTFGLEMAEKGVATPATLLAMGMLSENLRQRQLRAREAFFERFASFCNSENRCLFRQLFKTSKKGASEE